MTCQRFINRHVKFGNLRGDMTIVLDERCQAGIGTWHELLAVSRLPKVQWLVMGDGNQFPPVNQTWGGEVLTKTCEETAMLKHLCGGNRLTLIEGKRSCQTLFDFYSSLARHGQRFNDSLESQIEAARRAQPAEQSHRGHTGLDRLLEWKGGARKASYPIACVWIDAHRVRRAQLALQCVCGRARADHTRRVPAS